MFPPVARVNQPESGERPMVLVAATLFWPLSARLAIRFLEYGCRVAALCPEGHYLRHIEGVERSFLYRSFGSINSLEHAIREVAPALVVPCDDRVVWQLHELHQNHPELRAVIEASLGDPTGFEVVECRAMLLETARTLGITIPRTKEILSEEDLSVEFQGSDSAAVLKLDGTWGGEGVAIVRSAEEARKAFRKLSKPASLMTKWKRLVVNRDPLSLWHSSKPSASSMILQGWIDGRPANSMLACWKGEVLSTVSVEVLASEGMTGAAFLVRVIEDERMTRNAQLLASKLQLTGFCGLDYLIEKTSRIPYLIEVNPRCTQLGHLTLADGYDLASLLCRKLTGHDYKRKRDSLEGRVVAFFPQADRWTAQCPLPAGAYHDIPENQPRLVSELMQPIWPERQWISRVYHQFQRARKAKAVECALWGDEMSGDAGWTRATEIASR